jgi:hypothetical protein
MNKMTISNDENMTRALVTIRNLENTIALHVTLQDSMSKRYDELKATHEITLQRVDELKDMLDTLQKYTISKINACNSKGRS